jgi:SAM-dependent methyltransferase
MTSPDRPSLENLVESTALPLELLHPGGLAITRELAARCRIGAGRRVLDVASGPGASACFLADELGAGVVGLDASPAMLDSARRRAEARSVRIRLVGGDAEQLPFVDAAFDVVISECTLSLLDKTRAIREMVRVARAGGHVGMHDLCWRDPTPAGTKRRLAEIEGERPETLAGWQELFRQAGLTEVVALDRSPLISDWIRDTKRRLGLRGQARIFLAALRRWGPGGLLSIWRSQRTFEGRHLGYGLIVGRRP